MATNTKGRKTTSARKNTTAQRARKKQEYALKREVTLLITLAVCVLLFLCNFKLTGEVGNKVSDIMFGLLGQLSYIFPLFLFGMVLFKSANPGNKIATRKAVFAIVLFVDLGIALDLISGISRTMDSYSMNDIYLYCKGEHKGAGIFAGSLAYLLNKYTALAGSIVIMLLLLIISLIFLTEKSFVHKVKDGTERLMVHTNENRELRREYYEEQNRLREEKLLERQNKKALKDREKEELINNRRLQKEINKEAKENDKILRKDMTVSGVTFNTEILPRDDINVNKMSSEKDDIHEINLNGFSPSSLTYNDNIDNIKINTLTSDDTEEETIIFEEEKEIISSIFEEPPILGARSNNTGKRTTVNKPLEKQDSDITKKNEAVTEAVNVASKPLREYKLPPINLLTKNTGKGGKDSEASIRETARKLTETLEIFGVKATVTDISQGPTVTRYELQPDLGVKVSRIKNLSDDIKLSLAAADIRIEAPIPGKAAVGIEIPNKFNQAVLLRDLIDSNEFKSSKANLTFAVGMDISGKVIVYDIDKFPHLLIAGATGSGKSVCINTLIMSIVYKADPDDVKLIMIDPKVVELSVYNGIPHLMIPVVTDPKKASAALNWAVAEMMERYKKFADMNVRDLEGYNHTVQGMDSEVYKKLPEIVIIVDELADLVMVAKNEVEDSICRLSQLARAAGIHLIIATQRPSVDVITGLIKANMPSRLAFAVSSGTDSRTILDMNGAEELLGKGDMLFFPKGLKKPVRLQGGYVSDEEVNKVVDYLKNFTSDNDSTDIESKISSMTSPCGASGSGGSSSDIDELFVDAGRFIIDKDKASIGLLQRVFKIGFNRAARIMDSLAEYGVVSTDEGTKARQVLMTMDQFENLIEEEGL